MLQVHAQEEEKDSQDSRLLDFDREAFFWELEAKYRVSNFQQPEYRFIQAIENYGLYGEYTVPVLEEMYKAVIDERLRRFGRAGFDDLPDADYSTLMMIAKAFELSGKAGEEALERHKWENIPRYGYMLGSNATEEQRRSLFDLYTVSSSQETGKRFAILHALINSTRHNNNDDTRQFYRKELSQYLQEPISGSFELSPGIISSAVDMAASSRDGYFIKDLGALKIYLESGAMDLEHVPKSATNRRLWEHDLAMLKENMENNIKLLEFQVNRDKPNNDKWLFPISATLFLCVVIVFGIASSLRKVQ